MWKSRRPIFSANTRIPIRCRSNGPWRRDDLGNALATLGERESGTGRLEQAVDALHAALAERTRQRVPLQWATTQNNLGSALAALGERESGTARLEQAVDAYRAALTERTRERLPLDWASSTGRLGVAQTVLAERTGDARAANTALSQIELALATVREDGDAPLAEYLAAQLPKARALVERLRRP